LINKQSTYLGIDFVDAGAYIKFKFVNSNLLNTNLETEALHSVDDSQMACG